MRTRIVGIGQVVLAVLLVFGLAAPALAGQYPDEPVKLYVSYSPGGATDFQARIVTMKAQDYLGQPIVVINKPGGGGMVGWNWFVTSAKDDGYELVAYNIPHFIAQSIVYPKKAKYNINNMEPVANWGTDPAVLVVPKDSPFNSVSDLVDYAKKNPGKLTVSGAGLYVGHHIALLQLEKATGMKARYVPYKGGAPALLGVISGEVKAGFNNLSDAYRSRDRLKILAVADLERDSFLPDTPTFLELGFNVDDTSNNRRGIAAPKGTPPELLEKLSTDFVKMFNDKKIQSKMKQTGCGLKVMGRDDLRKEWQRVQDTLTVVLKGLRAD
ncbi:MAG: tripartite tricarboxylate transporter substrate binding protein [Nitrospirota bacterium]|jgi:tripartite-type tricarboxylate transporter receptor subunit TctC